MYSALSGAGQELAAAISCFAFQFCIDLHLFISPENYSLQKNSASNYAVSCTEPGFFNRCPPLVHLSAPGCIWVAIRAPWLVHLLLLATDCTSLFKAARENTEQQKFNLSTWSNILKPVGGENRRFKVCSINPSPSAPEYEFHTQPRGEYQAATFSFLKKFIQQKKLSGLRWNSRRAEFNCIAKTLHNSEKMTGETVF